MISPQLHSYQWPVSSLLIVELNLWPVAKITSWATNSSPHTKQWLPWVRPFCVHVTSNASSTTTVCPKAEITFCSTNTLLHSEQYFPWVNPVVVHVASFEAITASTWPNASTYVSTYESLHEWHTCVV